MSDEAMPGDDRTTSGAIPAAMQEFAAQLRAATLWLQSLPVAGARMPSATDIFPFPGALSAAQLRSVADNIVAQRRSIEALQAQLSAFDRQLAVLEQIVRPLAEWSGAWADFERRLLPKRPGSEAGDPGPRSSLPHPGRAPELARCAALADSRHCGQLRHESLGAGSPAGPPGSTAHG